MVALLTAGLWTWTRGLDGPYVFDDHTTPLNDPASQSISAWWEFAPVTLRPLTKLTYAVEAETRLTSTAPSRRVVSIVLLIVSAGLLLTLVHRLAPDATWYSAIALAGVWLLHPVHADSVLLASGRSAVLSNLFILAALLACSRSRWTSAVMFALACLARETAIAALFPLIVLTVAERTGRIKSMIRELTPTLLVAAGVVIWILTTPRYMALAEYSLLGRPLWESVIAQVGAVPVGLGLLVNTPALSIDYGIALPTSATQPLFLLGLLLYLAAGVGVVALIRRSPAAAVGLAVWIAALLPTQSVVPKLDALSNRPLALALAGLLLAAVPLVAACVRRAGPASARPWPWAARVLPGAAVAALVWLVIATAARADLFRSELRLWEDAAAKSVVNERPFLQYAVLLRNDGRARDATAALAKAARINPFNGDVTTMARILRIEENLR